MNFWGDFNPRSSWADYYTANFDCRSSVSQVALQNYKTRGKVWAAPARPSSEAPFRSGEKRFHKPDRREHIDNLTGDNGDTLDIDETRSGDKTDRGYVAEHYIEYTVVSEFFF